MSSSVSSAITMVMEEEIRVLEELERRRLEDDFASYVREAWKVLHPFVPLVEGWYLDAIADYLTSVSEGTTKRLIINQPPRTLKSTITSVMFPTWIWIKQPWWRFIFYTYAFDKLGVPQSLERRRLIESDWYQQRWGNVYQLSSDENKAWLYSNTKTGRMEVVSQATGTGGNCVIIDDPHSTEQAFSDAEREAGVRMVRQGLLTRLDDRTTGSVIVVMQRLHEKDVAGSLLADGGWTNLCLPVIQEEKEETIELPACKKQMVRKIGDLIDPVRLGPEVIKQLRVELGSRGFAGQYMQTPAPAGGEIFLSTWWQWFDVPSPSEVWGLVDEIIVSCDPSVKDKESGSDAAIQAWGISGIKSYLLDRDTQKRNYAATKAAIRAMMHKWHADLLLCEDKSNGPAVMSELKGEFHLVAYNPDWGDKTARASACSPQVEAGNVYLPSGEHGTYIQRVATLFPNVEMKDDIDCMSNFLNWRRGRGSSMGWMKKAAERAEAELAGTYETSNDQSLVKPDVKKLHEAANEAAGMVKPTEARVIPKTKPAPTECKFCGAPGLFVSTSGCWCRRGCGRRYPNA